MDSFHCPDYEELTIEEKILVDKGMKIWFKEFDDTCVPSFIFKVAEARIIERLKEKEKHGGSSHRRRNDL